MKLNDLVENDKVRHYFLFAMFLMAFLLRLGFTYQEYSQNGTQGWVDAKVYLANGISFSEGDYYPQTDGYMQVGPAIPVIVALSNLIFSDPIWPVLVLNCLISALLVFILYELGKTVISKIAGILLASWSVFNFSFIRLNHQILKEPYLIALIPLITLLMIYVYQNKNTMRNIVLSSLLFSALIHTDERFIVYGPLIFIAILLCRKVKRRFLYAVLWGTVLLCSMVPWTVRNFNEFG
ncbi:MAG: glycosyltransferase family 39 protein, partial [Candidatus Cloacimonetes bacterium]|nr:glycosyltransferase family 39 protein [Candidatus Cloacimonadota bacterium]